VWQFNIFEKIVKIQTADVQLDLGWIDLGRANPKCCRDVTSTRPMTVSIFQVEV
jgi:hypothetical protein